MNKMSDAQRRKIFMLAGEKGLDSEMLHGFITNLTGKDSMTQLSITEAIKVIDGLDGKKANRHPQEGGTRVSKTPGSCGVFSAAFGEAKSADAAGMITAKQRKFIEGLAKDIGWVDDTGGVDEKRLGGFLYARYGISAINWLTAKKASDAIEGLKAMKGRMKEVV